MHATPRQQDEEPRFGSGSPSKANSMSKSGDSDSSAMHAAGVHYTQKTRGTKHSGLHSKSDNTDTSTQYKHINTMHATPRQQDEEQSTSVGASATPKRKSTRIDPKLHKKRYHRKLKRTSRKIHKISNLNRPHISRLQHLDADLHLVDPGLQRQPLLRDHPLRHLRPATVFRRPSFPLPARLACSYEFPAVARATASNYTRFPAVARATASNYTRNQAVARATARK